MRTTLLLALLALALLISPARAQDAPPNPPVPTEYERIVQMINKHIRTNHIPGAALAIVNRGELDYTHAFGVAGEGRDMRTFTPFYIASLSKPLTAFAVMQLVEAGQVDLDAPVRAYLPTFQVADPDASARITVRHLLNQTSGLSDLGYSARLPDTATIAEAVADLARAEPQYPPGTRFAYFNPNYTTLGRIIEVVSGQTYAEYMTEHVFEPLDMRRTYTNLADARAHGLAQGHIVVFGYPVPRTQRYLNYDLPAGFIISTVEDMSRFLIPHLEGGAYDGVQLLSPQSIQAMHTVPEGIDSMYGMGWWVAPPDVEPRQLQHGGELDAFHGDMVLLPDLRQGFVILYNQNHLFYSLVTFNTVRDGIVTLLTGGPEPFTISLTFFYRIAMILFIVHVILIVRAFSRLTHWERLARRWSPPRRALNIAVNLLLPVVLIIFLPIILVPLVGRSASWDLLFNKLPVLMTWLYFFIVMSAARGIAKIWLLTRHKLPIPLPNS